jgi:peptidoglycan hydrolase-like protein with peptidoglycan-binding domain
MLKVRNLGMLLAMSSVAVLPACSMFGGGSHSSAGSSSNYAATQPPPPPPQVAAEQQPLTPDTVREVQQSLQQQGLYKSRIDGVWGPGTQAAVRNYQQQHNMTATGQLDQQTLASLTGGNQQQGSAQQPQSSNQAYYNNNNAPTQPMGSRPAGPSGGGAAAQDQNSGSHP